MRPLQRANAHQRHPVLFAQDLRDQGQGAAGEAEVPPVRRYDSSTDRVYGCTIMYLTPAGRWVQVYERTIAPTSEEALALAEKIVRADKRRVIQSIEHRKAYEQ